MLERLYFDPRTFFTDTVIEGQGEEEDSQNASFEEEDLASREPVSASDDMLLDDMLREQAQYEAVDPIITADSPARKILLRLFYLFVVP